ncbi:MAG: tRNA (adenosine(37)-N6)-threonylcarbamoyltransferase complex ATPase subunit type 1 TsaE [archaeon]|nr:tRNA (adenosine(37)-N6)-threonylcarbamoyltransferase complex ATPase subunit type 1 TsaE [archaeon]
MIKETNSLKETIDFGIELGKNSKRGDVFCLVGDLGTGKTMMSKGIAMGLGLNEDEITSPTFTIVNTYDYLEKPLYHFDVYRINDLSEMDDIGYEEMFYGDGVCIVEWADMVKDLIPDNATWIYIEKNLDKGLDYRQIKINE